MPSFCTSCGKPLDASAAFCASCGTRTAAQNVASAPPVVTQAPPPATVVVQPVVQAPAPQSAAQAAPAKSGGGGGTLLKIVLGLLLVGLLLVVSVIGAVIYGAYRVKKKADELGISKAIEDGTAQARSAAQSPATKRDPCSLITKEEMAEASGLEIVQVTVQTPGEECLYATADLSEPTLVRTTWGDGKLMMLAVRGGGKLMETGPGTELQKVANLGDEAYYQTNTLTVRKGDNAFSITFPGSLLTKDLTAEGFDMVKRVAEIRDKEASAARKALGRM